MAAWKFGAGMAAVVAVSGAAFFLLDQSRTDRGGNTPTNVEAQPNQPAHDQMKVVSPREGDRRATVGREEAEESRAAGQSHDGETVITQETGPEMGEKMPPPEPEKKEPPEPQVVYRDRVIEKRVEVPVPQPYVVAPQEVPVSDGVARARVTQQIDALLGEQPGAFVIRQTAKPEKPAGAAGGNGGGVPGLPMRLVARAGDVIYGMLDRGFNSDDPNAPLVVTLYDVLRDGRQGPLYGTRLIGTIQYTASPYSAQSAVVFNRMVLPDGRELPTNALAISEKDARTGIASKVDNHTLSRWSALVAGTLLQGAGNVGQSLMQNNVTAQVQDGVTIVARNPVNWTEAAVAAVQPLGQAASQVAMQKFNRPPTVSGEQGMGIGVVFMQAVQLPYR